VARADGERRLAALVSDGPGGGAPGPSLPHSSSRWPSPSSSSAAAATAPEDDLVEGAALRTRVALEAAARRATVAVATPRRRWVVRPTLALVAGAVVLVLACAVVLRTVAPSRPTVLASLDDVATAAGTGRGGPAGEGIPATGAPATGAEVVVHVVGEVGAPGVVRLPAGSRVVDAVDAAGGATASAQLSVLNLARVLEDGEQVVVPGVDGSVPVPAAGTGAAAPADDRLDLNAADAAALDALPGIGPVLAGRIVAWREEHGRFSTVDELAEVDGIGPSVLASVRDLVRA
jgi:competence protein ComEA